MGGSVDGVRRECPAVEGGLAGTYGYSFDYDKADHRIAVIGAGGVAKTYPCEPIDAGMSTSIVIERAA